MSNETKAAKDRLTEDMKAVIHDMEELLKATAGQTGDKISAVRTRAEENLREMQRKLHEMEDNVVQQAKTAAKATDHYVHENPWQAIAITAGVAFLLGMLTSRR